MFDINKLNCIKCGTEMKHYIGCDNGKHVVEFFRCPKCWWESKRIKLHVEDLNTYKINKTNEKDVKKVAGKRRKSAGLRRNG